ncbi:MAG: glycoside hydrolase family 5 protein [Bacteroidales bacterium]|nr:glycoside hydrolase family 5 protein [Bacteroidales bacterium]
MRKALFLYLLAAFMMVSCVPDEDTVIDDPDPVPENPTPEPKPEPEPSPAPLPAFETAYEAVQNMGVGWNLGNTLDAVWWTGGTDGRDWKAWETGWGQPVTKPELMTMMRDAGFGAIRVPATWGVHMDADGKVYDEWMNRVNEVVDYVINAGMYCILNVHHDTGADEGAWLVAGPDAYSREKERFEGLWTQIAERFKDYDQRLLFEGYNEMLDESRSWCYASMNLGYDATAAAEAYQAINDYAQSFVDAVRATGGNNAVRNLVVNTYGSCNGVGDWSPYLPDPLKYMKKPVDSVEEHILFQVHSYPMIDNLASMESEVSYMLDLLEAHLEPLGGPVIVGEWGTFSENPPLENYCHYADYFVRNAKERGIGTFHWMSISDGIHRSIPVFSHPEIAESIVKAWHGAGFTPEIPVLGDYDLSYKVTYNSLWSELNLSSSTLYLDEYKGVTFELEETPPAGSLHIKVYGESDGKEQFGDFEGASGTLLFDPSIIGSKSQRVTLQYTREDPFTITVRRVALIRTDDTEEECSPSTFWGCTLELIVS